MPPVVVMPSCQDSEEGCGFVSLGRSVKDKQSVGGDEHGFQHSQMVIVPFSCQDFEEGCGVVSRGRAVKD